MLAAAQLCHAQSGKPVSATPPGSASPRIPSPLDSALANFFVRSWNCAGEFSSDKPIASRMTFASILENHWLELHHDDLPPNRFHAVSEWGVNLATG